MSSSHSLSTQEKALQINLASGKYGTLAEIGAGQEVARWFFRAGGAAGLIAKTISAYDMTFSDAIYGTAERYVSRHRLATMLDYEYNLVVERLGRKRGAGTSFFAFSDTMAARSYSRHEDGQGWMGVKFQANPGDEPSSIIIHLQMFDHENVREQEAIGIMGVNLMHGAFFLNHQPEALLLSLMDGLGRDRVEVDMIKFSGPAFSGLDNRLMSLHLVRHGLADSAMFTAEGDVVQAAEVLYKKPILVERGSFRPVTLLTQNMIECAQDQFLEEEGALKEDPVIFMEMTMRNLIASGGDVDPADFLERVDILGALGKNVLISNYGEYYRLVGYFSRYTRNKIGIALGIPSLKEMFDPKYYETLQGGLLESMGRLFRNGLRLYVLPLYDPVTGDLTTVENLRIDPVNQTLYDHLIKNRFIEGIKGFKQDYLHIFSSDVLSLIQKGDAVWETMVPSEIVEIIKDRKLFGFKGKSTLS